MKTRIGTYIRKISVPLLIVIGLFATGCGGVDEANATTEKDPAAVSGSFVGKVEGAEIGVAVVAGEPAAEGQARTLSVYVCDGRALSLWFTGQAAGNQADLSTDGVSATVVVRAEGTSGTIALSGGRKLAFTALPASGAAGLYNVTVAANGTVRGTSETGSELTGQLAASEAPDGGPVVATASSGDQDVKLEALARQVRPGAYRWIVTSDRKVYGANSKGPSAGGVGGPSVSGPTDGSIVKIDAFPSPNAPDATEEICNMYAGFLQTTEGRLNDAIDSGADMSTLQSLYEGLEGGIEAAGNAGCIVLF